jgi:hypothetical protein
MTVLSSQVTSVLPVALGHDPTASLCPWVQATRSTADYPSRKAQIAVALLNGTLTPTSDVVDLMYRCDGLCRCQPLPAQPDPTPYTNLIHDARAALVSGGFVPAAEQWTINWHDHGNVYGRIEFDESLLDRNSPDGAVLYVPGTASLFLDPAAVAANAQLLRRVFGSVAIDPELLDSGYVLRQLGLQAEWETERDRIRELIVRGGYQSVVTTTPREAMGLATALADQAVVVSSLLDSVQPWMTSMRTHLRPPDSRISFALQPTEEMAVERESAIILLEHLAHWSGREIVTLAPEATSPAAIERPILPSTEQLSRRFAETRADELLEIHDGEKLVVLTVDPFSKRALTDQLGARARVANVATFLCEHLEGERTDA